MRNHCLNGVSPSASSFVEGQDTRAEILLYKHGPQNGQQQPITKLFTPAIVWNQLQSPRAHSPCGGPPTWSYSEDMVRQVSESAAEIGT